MSIVDHIDTLKRKIENRTDFLRSLVRYANETSTALIEDEIFFLKEIKKVIKDLEKDVI